MRIKSLQEKTASLEAKDICKEILENFVNLPDVQIATVLVEKLKTVGDSDKHVTKFIQAVEKIESINDLGVAKGIAFLKETQIYSYPGLKYALEKIENSLVYKQVKIVESNNASKEFRPGDTWSTLNLKNSFRLQENNVSGQPEYMLVDAMLESLKNFIWDASVESIYRGIKTKREELRENIDIAISIYNMKSNKGSFFFDSIIPRLEEHFLNPTVSSRSSIIEDLRKLNFYPVARNLSESLARIQNTANSGVQIVSDNTKCEVSSIYSPVLLENDGEYFYVRGNYFCKKAGNISKVTEGEVSSLPEKFRELCRIISSPHVFIKEGKISFYLKKDKVEILENEKKVEVRFNGKKVSGNDLAKNMVSAGLFRLEESRIAYDVQSLAESFENIYDIDFGKVIESKLYKGSFVILMKNEDSIYINKVNESNRSNEFFSKLNSTQARNQILEFVGFDIKESMLEYLEKDESHLKELREHQLEVVKSISIVESNLNRLISAMGKELVAKAPEIVELKSALEYEMLSLKATHRSISEKIKAFENRSTSDIPYEAGEEVKLNDTGEIATITSVDSTRNMLVVVTSTGRSVEVPATKVSSVESNMTNSAAKNAEDEESKKKQPQE